MLRCTLWRRAKRRAKKVMFIKLERRWSRLRPKCDFSPNDNEVGSILVAAADLAGLAQPKIEAGFFAELSELLEFRVNA